MSCNLKVLLGTLVVFCSCNVCSCFLGFVNKRTLLKSTIVSRVSFWKDCLDFKMKRERGNQGVGIKIMFLIIYFKSRRSRQSKYNTQLYFNPTITPISYILGSLSGL